MFAPKRCTTISGRKTNRQCHLIKGNEVAYPRTNCAMRRVMASDKDARVQELEHEKRGQNIDPFRSGEIDLKQRVVPDREEESDNSTGHRDALGIARRRRVMQFRVRSTIDRHLQLCCKNERRKYVYLISAPETLSSGNKRSSVMSFWRPLSTLVCHSIVCLTVNDEVIRRFFLFSSCLTISLFCASLSSEQHDDRHRRRVFQRHVALHGRRHQCAQCQRTDGHAESQSSSIRRRQTVGWHDGVYCSTYCFSTGLTTPMISTPARKTMTTSRRSKKR